MGENRKLVQDVIDKIKEVTDLFYQQNSKEAYKQFNEVLDQLTLVAQTLFSLESVSEMERNTFLNYMRDAVNAMEGKDWILLADILQYDINEFFEDMVQRL